MAATGIGYSRRQARTFVVALLGLIVALGGILEIGGKSGGTALVPVIVRQQADASAQARHSISSVGGRVTRELGLIDGFAAHVPANSLARLTGMPGVAAVTADAQLSPLEDAEGEVEDTNDPDSPAGSIYNITRVTGARWFWALGYTGRGVDVAVIDTGISPVRGLSASGKLVNGADFSFESPADNLRHLDTYGHGTHMAGIVAGRDPNISYPAFAGPDKFLGMAPGARVLNVKVANAMGATDVSQVIAAIDWVVRNRERDGLNIRVLNLSFGTDGVQHYTLDPLAYAVEQAWHKGIVVVVAAGNSGFGSAKLNNPAYNPWVIAVGASDTKGTTTVSDDVVPPYSSTGDKQRNPDLVAPGKSVISLRVPGSQLDNNRPEGRVGERFFKGSGTSQAAAVVSGAAALVIDQRPNITPDQLKDLLTRTARPLPNTDPVAQGHGTLNLTGALVTSTDKGAAQGWERSSGTGSLDAARGNLHVADPWGNVLNGERDIFDRPFKDGLWGEPCATEAESTEPCVEWTGNSWSAMAWAGNSWSGNSWSGNSWSGNSWSGNSWSGNSWSGNSWSGNSWSGNSWSGNSWSSSGWLGVSWGRRFR